MLVGALTASCSPSRANGISKTDNSTQITRSVNLTNFSAIDASHGIQVTYTPGKLSPASVTAPDYVYDYLKISVSKGTLKLGIDNKFFEHHNAFAGKVTISVSAPEVNDFEASSGSSINVAGALRVSGKCSFDISSGASVNCAHQLTAQKIDIEVSSGASMKAAKFDCHELEVDLSSGASATLAGIAADEVDAEASSGSSMKLEGKTKLFKADTSSGASIHAGNLSAVKGNLEASSGSSIEHNTSDAVIQTDKSSTIRKKR